MAENEILIRIGAQENTTEAFRKVADQLGLLGKQTQETASKFKLLSKGVAQTYSGLSIMGSGATGLVAGLTTLRAGLAATTAAFTAMGTAAKVAISIVTLGAAAVVLGTKQLYDMSRGSAKLGETLYTMHLQTGIAVESLSTLKYAAEQSNVELETVAMGLRILARNASEATHGNKEQAKAFRSLGIAVKNVRGELRPAEALMRDVANRLKAVKSDTERTAMAMQFFGRAGFAMMPFLISNFEALQEEARGFGLEMTKAEAVAGDDLGDAFTRLGAAIGGTSKQIGATFVPTLIKMVNWLTTAWTATVNGVKAFNKWVNELNAVAWVGFRRLAMMTKIVFTNMWTNVTVLWRLYVLTPILASWQFLLEKLGGALGFFGVDVEGQLANVRAALMDMEGLELVSPLEGVRKAIDEIKWPDFTAGIDDATTAVKDFKEEVAVEEIGPGGQKLGARFMGLPQQAELNAWLGHHRRFNTDLLGIYVANWNTMVADHASLWTRFSSGVVMGVADYKEKLSTFTSSVKDEVERAMGDLQRGLSGGIQTLFFGREDKSALDRSTALLRQEARAFSNIQLDVFGDIGTATQVDAQKITNVFARAAEGLSPSLKRQTASVRDKFLGLADPDATPESVAAASKALEDLVQKMKSQSGFIGRLSEFGDQMRDTLVTAFETGLSNILAGAIMRGLIDLGESAVGAMSEDAGKQILGAVGTGTTREDSKLDFATKIGGSILDGLSKVFDDSSFKYIMERSSHVLNSLALGAEAPDAQFAFSARIGNAVTAGFAMWAVGTTLGLPSVVVNSLAIAETALVMFKTNIANEVASVFGKGDKDSLLAKIEGNLGGAVRGAFLGAGIGAMFGTTGAIGGAIGGGLAGAMASALGVAGPLGGAIAAIGAFMTSTIFASFAASTTAAKRYEGITGEAVEAFKLGGIGKLESADLTRQQRLYGRADRGGQSSAIRDLAQQIRQQLPGLNEGESRDMAQALLTNDYYGARGAMLNGLIRGELVRQAAEEQRKMRTISGIFTEAEGVTLSGSTDPRTQETEQVTSGSARPAAFGAMTLSLSRLSDAARAGMLSTTLEAQGIPIGSGIFNNVIGLLQGDPAASQFLTSQGYSIVARSGIARVPGSPSTPVPAILHGQEMVLPARQAEQVRSGGGLGGGVTVNFYLQSASDREMVAMLQSQLPMIERAVSEAIRKGSRFGNLQFDERMIRTTLQS